VEECIGVEHNYPRCKTARNVICKLGLDDTITVFNHRYEIMDLYNGDFLFIGFGTIA